MIYRFKATIPGSKLFMREYEIPGDYSLFKLHTWLTSQFEFNPDQIVAFRGINATGKSKSLYGLFDMGDGSMDAVTIEQCIKKGEIFIQYIYNIQRGSVIVFSLIEEDVPLMPRCTYPRLVAEKGKDPDQFEKNVDDEQSPTPKSAKISRIWMMTTWMMSRMTILMMTREMMRREMMMRRMTPTKRTNCRRVRRLSDAG